MLNIFQKYVYANRKLCDVANALEEHSRGPDVGVDLLWPRSGCQLLRECTDTILVDSPGIDVEADFDLWIQEYCQGSRLLVTSCPIGVNIFFILYQAEVMLLSLSLLC